MKSPFPRRGLASVMAIMLLLFLSVAFVAMGALMNYEVKRTCLHRVDAQLRQVMLAVPGQVERDRISLPAELQEAGVKISLRKRQENARLFVEIEASLEGRYLRQEMFFEQAGSGWRLASVEIRP